MSEKDVVEMYIDSLAEHAGQRRLADLRNESSKGKQRTGGEAKGDALSAFDKEDFRVHVRNMLNDPNTEYMIDESSGRIEFFNANQSNNTRAIFNPAQFTDGDGHAGTLVRDAFKDGAENFAKQIKQATKNMDGISPEIRSVSDGGHIEHLEKYRTQLENVPDRVLGKGDLRSDFHQAGDNLKAEPLLPLDYNASNAPKVTKDIALEVTEAVAAKAPSLLRGAFEAAGKHGGTITGVVIGTGVAAYTLGAGGSPAQAAGAAYETAVPYGEAQVNIAQGDVKGGAKSAVVETVSNVAFGVCAVPGGALGAAGGSVVPVVGTAIGGGTGQVNNTYDYLSGNTAQMKEIYDALPVLPSEANDNIWTSESLAKVAS